MNTTIASFKELEERIAYLSIEEIRNLLSRKDYFVYKRFLNCNRKTSKYANRYKLSYNTAASEIYKMRKNLKASYLRSNGITKSKHILTYNQHKNVLNFINKLIEKANEDDLESLQNYFYRYKLTREVPYLIKTDSEYDIKLIEDDLYELTFSYKDKANNEHLCEAILKIDKRNYVMVKGLDFHC